MERYEKYKDSGVEWIGEIPAGWESVRLKYAGQSIIGIIYSPSDVTDESNGILVLRSSNIQNRRLAFDDCIYVSKAIENKHLTKEGDVLLCARNGSAHLVGKAAHIGLDDIGLTFGAFMSVVRSPLGKYLFYIFNSQIFKAQIGLFSTSTINQLTSDTLNNMVIAFPKAYSEQTAITNYLDRKTAEIDALIAQKERLIELYEEEKTAIINQAVTKGAGSDVGVPLVGTLNNKGESIDKENGADQGNHKGLPLRDSGIDWLGDIPEGWEVKKLKYVAKIHLGKMLTNAEQDGYFCKPYLRAANLLWLNVDVSDVKEMWFSEAELRKLRLQQGDLLVSEGGEVGRTAIWNNELEECYIQNSVHKIKFNKNCNSKYYLYLFFAFGHRGFFDAIVNKISIGHLTGEKLKEIEIISPCLSEQTAIVQHIETETARIDTKIAKTKRIIELQKEYRTALISEVVTGKINVGAIPCGCP